MHVEEKLKLNIRLVASTMLFQITLAHHLGMKISKVDNRLIARIVLNGKVEVFRINLTTGNVSKLSTDSLYYTIPLDSTTTEFNKSLLPSLNLLLDKLCSC